MKALIDESDITCTQFRALANCVPTLLWMANPDGWIHWYNQRWYDYTGKRPDEMAGWGWQSVHHPDILPDVLERWTGAIATGASFEMTFPLRGKDGTYRPFLTRVEPLHEDGRIVGWYGSNTEVTDLENTRERLELMVGELNHRVKNTLATVQSIAAKSFRDAPPENRKSFEGRLRSLANVHDVLTRESWTSAKVDEMIQHTVLHADPGRILTEGPDLRLEPRFASALAMALNELATNAVKYGALSVPAGRIVIRWETAERGWMALYWQEQSGPRVAPPGHKGFGMRLIEGIFPGEYGVKVEHEFRPGGVTCAIRLPVDLSARPA